MSTNVSIKNFRASNVKALIYLILPAMLCGFGIYFSYSKVMSFTYLFSQIMFGVFFFQCFILLHETGHYSFFKNRLLNTLFGHFFAFASFIPFKSWIAIHNLHHKWTGYRDRDPTTEGTVEPKFGFLTKSLINVCWKFSLPLFTLGYRLGNYWNIGKMKRHLPAANLRPIYINMGIQILLYVLLFIIGGKSLFWHIAPGYFLSLMISDIFILSQHSHIEIPIAGNREVKPLRYADQLPYTRSIRLNKAIAALLYFNFNLHELHHAYPGLPAYHLNKIQNETPNSVGLMDYLRDAKGMSGLDFIFRTSSKKIGFSRQKNPDK